LQQPLDSQITLTHTLTNDDIYLAAQAELDKSPELRHIANHPRYEAAFRHAALTTQLRQGLSVMAQRLPTTYAHGLFSAWASTVIGLEMAKPPSFCADAYLCGLCHDLGLLHIPPTLIQRDGALSEEQWRALQSHVVIGKRLIEENCAPSKHLAQAVLEHHERLDQTGYPTRKPPEQLGELGRVIVASDLLHNLCSNDLTHHGPSMQAARPYLHVQRAAVSSAIHAAIFAIIRRGEGNASAAQESRLTVETTHQNLDNLMILAKSLRTAEAHTQQLSRTHEGQGVITLIASIHSIVQQSGLNDPTLKQEIAEDKTL